MLQRGATNLVIRNNVIQAFRIIQAFDSPGLSIINNTFTSNLAFVQFSPFGIGLVRSPNAVVANNIFLDIGAGETPYVSLDNASQSGTSIGHNAIGRSDGRRPGGSPYPNDLWGVDPKFAAPDFFDFYPRSDSPVIDAGLDVSYVLDDIDGNPRPQGQAYDIGAYEYKAP
jgi:hypothetical protein